MNKKLEKAVLKQIGISKREFKANTSDYRDASAGIPGFTYYNDTQSFALDNQSLIIELLEEMSEWMGVDVVKIVKGFGVFKPSGMNKEELKDLYKFLGGNDNIEAYETNSVLNVLAWLCVEQLAFELDE